MKSLVLTSIACCLLLSCEAGPQRSRDRKPESPAVKQIRPDSPAAARMPVLRTDTARQADMPVVVPPKNIQPK